MSKNDGAHCIVVGVDGSTNSLAALRSAAREATRRHDVLEVVFVVGREMTDGKPLREVTAAARDCLRHSVEAVLGHAPRVPVRLRVVDGDPGDVLPRLADGAELLFVGARNDPEQAHPLGGDTVPAVLAGSPCEVVVCADHQVSSGAA